MLTRDEVIAIAKECGEKVVDYDLFGKAISNIDVMFMGAYGPFAERFAAAAYRKGVEDSIAYLETNAGGWYVEHCIGEIRKLLEQP